MDMSFRVQAQTFLHAILDPVVRIFIRSHHYFMTSSIGFISLIGSIMVSYTRARAESLGVPCNDGLMQRPERVIVIGVSAVVCGIGSHIFGTNYKWSVFGSTFGSFEPISFFGVPLAFVAVMSNFTAMQRLYSSYLFLKKNDSAEDKK